MSTRGAQGWVRNVATGFPDWTTSVSSCSSRWSVGDDRVVGLPAPSGAAGTSVHNQFVRTFGNLGIEIVHQHPERSFLRPSLAANRRASRRADDPHWSAEGAHRAGGVSCVHATGRSCPISNGATLKNAI